MRACVARVEIHPLLPARGDKSTSSGAKFGRDSSSRYQPALQAGHEPAAPRPGGVALPRYVTAGGDLTTPAGHVTSSTHAHWRLTTLTIAVALLLLQATRHRRHR